jgi:multicomponent Na+:H+ antiporter subunit G
MLDQIAQAIVGILAVAGAFFCLVAALGVVRLPDALTRMHASSKAGTLGCGLVLLAVAIFFPGLDVVARVVAAILFLLLTTPVAAHMIGRAAYASGESPAAGTVQDDLANGPDNPRRRLLEKAGRR